MLGVLGEDIEKTPLPVGELRIEAPEELCQVIHRNWFPKNEAEAMDAD